jgi:ATP-binding cassette subfamily F protein 3
MLYEIKNGTVSLGGNEILSHFYFRMVDGEKIGIVGRNGAGKTTLLKLMNGEIELDYNDDNTMGEIVKSKDFNPGYLRQQLAGGRMVSAPTGSVYSYLLEAFNKLIEMEQRIEKLTAELAENYNEKKAVELNTLIDTYNFEGGHIYIKELKTGFKKFGFSEADLERPINEFSGGQSTKISLLKLLLSKPDVLMLDEPTNHLDIEAIEWMESYLQGYKKNIVIVSHDRMFLDNICNVIYDVENQETVRYEGNYADFVEQKEINYQLKLAEYNKNLKEIERLTALADRFRYKATKAKMVQSKDKVIEKLEEKTFKPTEADTKTFHVKIVPNKVGGKEVLRCTDLVVGYNEGIAKINCVVNRRDRLAVIGANGTGKSTFIKTIVGVLPKISGDYSYGHEIEFEYFDQRIAENSSTKTLFDDFSDEFPTYDNTEVRNRLGRFLFGEEDISKKVCDLSGGEKVRLCLAKIFERKPNLLILDEPTNHLDILGKESLEEIIDSFEGTVVFVSHDRYFVKKISNKVLFFEERARSARPYEERAREARPYDEQARKLALTDAKFFEFGYEDYEKYVKEKDALDSQSEGIFEVKTDEKKVEKTTDNSLSYRENKQRNRDDKKIKKLEDEIAKLEGELEKLNLRLQDSGIQSNFEELSAIQKEIDETNNAIMEKYEIWDKLHNYV